MSCERCERYRAAGGTAPCESYHIAKLEAEQQRLAAENRSLREAAPSASAAENRRTLMNEDRARIREHIHRLLPETPVDDPLVNAARQADWQQVVLNGGPPCFHIHRDDGSFCLRAKRWTGHTDKDEWPEHRFVSLADLLTTERQRRAQVEQQLTAKDEELRSLRSERDVAQALADTATRSKSPCDHYAAYAVTQDGGKTISCLQCRAEKAEAELRSLRDILRAVYFDRFVNMGWSHEAAERGADAALKAALSSSPGAPAATSQEKP